MLQTPWILGSFKIAGSSVVLVELIRWLMQAVEAAWAVLMPQPYLAQSTVILSTECNT
jgi:hypothetical protein